jgi:two-component system CheB/CheR fusion protein
MRPQIDEKGVEFAVDVDAVPLWVTGDAARLQQVQINLLSNAVKFTLRGGRISLHVRREAGGAVIRVKDNGAGIAPSMLDRVFDLFVQARPTLDHANGGLGVGLTLVRALVEMHGGTVAAHSDGEGTGSEFTVRLPLTTAARPTPGREESSSPSITPTGMTVLIVEDNTDSREMLCAMLKNAGLICHDAPDGVTALGLIDEVRPDAVILDVGLPEMDGLEVARRIRANPQHATARLIALTGYGRPGDRLATKEAGFDYHLVKPVAPAELVALLGQLRPSNTADAPNPQPRSLPARSSYAASAESSGQLGTT